MRFTRRRGELSAKLDRHEAFVLTAVVSDLLELLGPSAAEDRDADPLVALVGLSDGPVATPDDPALARLLPDAYGDDAPAAAEFRRYTEADLREGKRTSAVAVLGTLEPLREAGGRLVLDRDASNAWLATLNDLRLVLGTRLEVTEDSEVFPRGDAPQDQALRVYAWLGYLQESLLAVLEPRTS